MVTLPLQLFVIVRTSHALNWLPTRVLGTMSTSHVILG